MTTGEGGRPATRTLGVRTALVFLTALVTLTAAAQSLELVPAPRSAPGAMSVGCPADWEHRDAGVGSFSCRDTQTSAYCGMAAPSASDALATARTLDDAVGMARRWLTARGTPIAGERREGTVHALYVDHGSERLVVIVIPEGTHFAQVQCGTGSASLDATLPLMLAVAHSARR